ncbi:MAG: cohesin domain-containing protein [Candidatus Marinimicrobia bacterium]|nr:cohesin domain-containing protein [Candidatus Neomarinimicrobiota bacterium]
MQKHRSGYKALFLMSVLCFFVESQAQYGWNFQYALNNVTTQWRHLASGDTMAIASFTFSTDNPADPKSYYLKGFRLWPITNSTTGWFVDELQLYMDRGNRSFGADDSLISGGLAITIPDQSDSVNSISFNFGGDSLLLADNRMLFVVAIVHDWRDDDPENLEIDTTGAGPYGKWFSIKVFTGDFNVTPAGSNDVKQPLAVVEFGYQALNLPVTIRNELATSAENDSSNLNMFYPTFRSINGTAASKIQRIDDLSFYADIFLPVTNDSIELSIKSTSFQFGFDNRILEFESAEYGDVWNEDDWYYVDTSVTQVELYDENHPEYSIFQYSAEIGGSELVNNKYRAIDSSSVIRLKFNVIGPGISPIFIRNIDIRDRWGVQYHAYQHLQNYANVESGGNSDRFDAWAKYILGDYTFSGGDQISAAGICDGQVTWEDISLFSDYFWLNPASSRWYKRFDIGSSESVSPSQYSPDDTTNFYDLMVLGTNYRRTYDGAFNQKIVAQNRESLKIQMTSEELSSNLLIRINMKNVNDLQAAHLRLNFDSQILRFESIETGEWVKNVNENQLLLAPEALAEKGIIDLNFVSLGKSLNGEGEFAEIRLTKLCPNPSLPEIAEVDIRDSNCRSLSTFVVPDVETVVAKDFLILENYPNPFNGETRISYNIPESKAGNYRVMIVDIRGNCISTLENRFHHAGSYQFHWNGCYQNGQAVASGMYFLVLRGSGVGKIRKIMLLR